MIWILPVCLLFLVTVGSLGVALPAFGFDPALGQASFTLASWSNLAATPGLLHGILLSLATAILTSLASLIIVMSFLAGAGRARRWSERLIGPLLAIPHTAAAIGLAFLIAPSGWLMRWLSPWATGFDRPPDLLIPHDPLGASMILGLIVKEVPFLFLVAVAALPLVGERERMSQARSLGYQRTAAWLKVVAPELYIRIRLPVLAVVAYASSNVEVALILGPTNPPALSIMTFRLLHDPDLAVRGVASAAALTQIIVTGLAILIWIGLERALLRLLSRSIEKGRRDRPPRLMGSVGRFLMVAVIGISCLLLVGLLVNSVAWSWRYPDVMPDTVTLAHWTRAMPGLSGPMMTSLTLGLASSVTALLIVIAMLEAGDRRSTAQAASSWIALILFLPLFIPQIGFVAGLVIFFEMIGLRPGWPPVLLGHLILVIPYIYLILNDTYQRFDPRYVMIAQSTGASSLRTLLQVRLPILSASLLAALAIGFAVSIGQYLPTILLSAGRIVTVTTEAVALASGGDRRVLGVWSIVQTALPAIMFLLAILLPRLLWRHRRGMQIVH